MSVRLFTKTVHTMVCTRVEDGVCVFEDQDSGKVSVYHPGDRMIVTHDINIGGPDFLTDKRALKAFAAGLRSVGFSEKVTQ